MRKPCLLITALDCKFRLSLYLLKGRDLGLPIIWCDVIHGDAAIGRLEVLVCECGNALVGAVAGFEEQYGRPVVAMSVSPHFDGSSASAILT